MRIDRLELENWMSYPRRWPDTEGLSGSTEIVPTIELTTESLTLVAGENGAGKSAILEAICYALFAKYPRGDKNADAIRSGEKEAQVKLFFSLPTADEDAQYCVERLLKSNSTNATLKQIANDGTETVLETRQAPVTDYIERLLRGATYDAFVSTVFLRQEEAGKFMNLGPDQQRKQLLMLCRLEIYEQIYRKAKTLRDQYDRKVTDLETRFEEVKYATNDYLATQRKKTELLKESQAELRKQEKAATELLKNVRRVNTLTSEILELQQTLEEWEAILEQADQIRHATNWTAAWDRVRHTLTEARKTHERIVNRDGEIEQSGVELEGANKTVDNLTKPYEDLEGQYATATQTLNALRDELPTLIGEEQTANKKFHETKEAKALDEQITRLTAEQSKRQSQLANFGTVKQNHDYAALLKQSQTALSYTLSKLTDAQTELDAAIAKDGEAGQADQSADKLRQTLPDKQASLTKLKEESKNLQETENNLGAQVALLDELIKNRNKAIKAGKCPTCGLDLVGEVGEHVHADVEDLEQQLEVAKAKLLETSNLLETTNSTTRDLESDISKTEGQIEQLGGRAKLARESAAKARQKGDVAQEEADRHWQTHLGTWQEVTVPDWLRVPSEEVKFNLDQALSQLKDIDQEYQRLVGVQAKFESEASVLEGNRTRRANLPVQSPVSESYLAELEQAWQGAQIHLNAKKEERDELSETVKSLEKQVADSKTKLDNAKQEAGRIEKHLNGLKASQKTDQESLSRTKATLQDEQESCREQFPDLAKDLLLAVDDTEAHTRLAESIYVYSEIANRLEQLETAETESAEAKTTIKLKQSELDDLLQKVGDISEEVASKNLEDIQAELGQLDEEVLEANRQLGQIETHHQQREKIKPQLDQARKTRWAYQQIELALYPGTATKSPGKLRAQITEKLMDSIGQEASRILEDLGWHMAVKYSEQSGFTVHDRTLGVSRKYKEFSGGERFAIAIAVAMAVGRVTHGAGNIRCLFIDEGFGALDTKNRGRIINEAIGKLIENQWRDQVVVITHLEDVKGYFPHRIELVRKDDSSFLASPAEELV